MAPRVKRNIKVVEKDTTPEEALEEFGLEKGQAVKFQDHEVETGLVPARALYVEKDGSIRLIEGTSGHGTGRSIVPDRIRKLEIGPRGGRKWVPICSAE